MLAPMLVQMERQIDREIAADNRANGVGCGTQTELNGTNSMSTETEDFESDSEEEEDDDSGPMLMYGPMPQIITNDLKSLDEMVSRHNHTITLYLFMLKPHEITYNLFMII